LSDAECIVQEFLVESYENLDRFDRLLVASRYGPLEQPAVDDLFRAVHNLKGTAGCLGFVELESAAHAGEEVLESLRNSGFQFDGETAGVLRSLASSLRQMLHALGPSPEPREDGTTAIGPICNSLRTVVLALCTELHKKARLELHGMETQSSATSARALRLSLMHLIRNSMTHGIEVPGERARVGKPVDGRIAIEASRTGGRLFVRIDDDGAGIDGERIAASAVERGCISAHRVDALDPAEIVNLIFLPGVSGAREATLYAGRGIGLDAVRAMIEAAGGSVRAESRRGRGTSIFVELP
jgi:chemotaxis protein histidine kinase CheA